MCQRRTVFAFCQAYVATVEQLDSRLRVPRDSSALSTLDLRGRRPVIVETGVGASTIVLLNFAMKHDGLLYSWDPNGPKGALLRSVCTDMLVTYHQKLLQQHWKFVPYNSHSVHLGLPILDAPVEVRIKWRRGVPFLPDLTGLPSLIADRLGLPRLLGRPPQP